MKGHEVHIGGEGPIFKYVHNKLERSYLLVKSSSFYHANVWHPGQQ